MGPIKKRTGKSSITYDIFLTQKPAIPEGHSNRRFRPARAQLEAPDGKSILFCVDTGAGISLIRREVLASFPNIEVRTMTEDGSVRIHGVHEGQLDTNQYVILPITLKTRSGMELTIEGEVHVVDQLPVPLIMGNNLLVPHRIDVINSGNESMLRIHDQEVDLSTDPLPEKKAKRVRIKAANAVTVHPGIGHNIPVQYDRLHLRDEGYLVEPEDCHYDLAIGEYARLGRCLIHGNETRLPFANLGRTPVQIRQGQLLGYVESADTMAESETPVYLSMETIFEGLPVPTDNDQDDNPPTGFPFSIQPPDDDTNLTEANVSDHWGKEYETRIRTILQKYQRLFRKEMGMFNDGITMPVPFREDADLSKLKQAPYNLSKRDEEAIDAVIDPLIKEGRVKKVPLGKPSAAASPAFVVWKNNKPRVVVDLRRVNTALYPDAYPLPKQDTILSALGGGTIFSSLDIVKGFFQQPIDEADQWKTAFVTAKRGHEMLCVATMGLMNSPGFFQHRMEELFSGYLWTFILVYIDDILIFSRGLEQHIEHLDKALGLLESSGITLSISKCHFAFPSIQALGHHVSRLGLGTVQEKTEAIQTLAFPSTLALLEIAIGLFGYYRKFVEWFAAICKPLVELKTKGFKNAPIKGYGRDKHAQDTLLEDIATEEQLIICRAAFKELKNRLCSAPVLAFPDFERPFHLYVDGCKQKGFGAALHQFDLSDPPVERPVLYISKTLSPAEHRYWPTELETAALVWALQKLQQYTDQGQITVHCDHQAIIHAFKDQGPVKGKRSERLVNWRLYLARFAGRMEIVHKPGKEHRNADALSRLANVTTTAKSTADVMRVDPVFGRLYNEIRHGKSPHTFNRHTHIFSIDQQDHLHHHLRGLTQLCLPLDAEWRADLVQMTKKFRDEMVQALPKDPRLGSIYNDICKRIKDTRQTDQGPITTRESFRVDMDTKLMYQMTDTGHERLCIPAKFHRDLLTFAHDKQAHQGVGRVIDRLRQNVYIPGLRQVVERYIHSCPVCAATKPSRQPPLGQLQPISSPNVPFAVQTIDIIVSLSESKSGMTALLTVTDKFTKYIKLVPGKDTYDATDWAIAYYDYVYSQFGMPGVIISDRDPRWTSRFWKALFKRAGTSLAMTAAYHPAADGQSERTNQTVEVALRSLIAGNSDRAISDWDELLPDTEYALNTSVNASTGHTPFFLLYGVHPRTEVGPPTADCPEAEEFFQNRQRIREEASDTLKAAQARMAKHFDAKHTPIKNADRMWLKLARGTKHGYKLPNASDLDVIKTGPFTVKRRVSKVAFELDLPEHFKIHPVISCIHLEPALEDPYNRQPPPPAPVIVDGEERYIIDRILKKEQRRQPGDRTRRGYYKVRWQGYGPRDDSWIEEKELREQVPEMVEAFDRRTTTTRRKG